jgi:tetratricopeptide (TPR) repeat protein
LPISNAISCIKTGYLVDMVEPFFNKLEFDWKNNPEGKLLKAECLVIMGEIQLAKEEFESILIRDEIYLSPTEIKDLCQDTEDLSIISSLDLRHYHYTYAKTLLQLRSFSDLLFLSENSHSWSEELNNGDWKIFTAEVFRRSKQFDNAINIVSSMQLQSPPLLTEALIYRDEGKTNLLESVVDKFFQEIVSDFCFHPSGIPEAIFYALRSNIELEKLNYELAIDLAEKSVLKDPASIECCIALAVALKCSDLKKEAIKVLQTGLSIIPHSPELLSLLIELLIDTQEIENAEAMLVRYRPLLENNNFITDAHRLGELICIAKLAAQNGNFDEKEFCNLQAWNWIDKKTNPVNSWLKGAVIARNRAEYLRTAEVMYFAKVIEYLLVECVFNPFKKYCKNNALELDSKQFQSVVNFINKDMQVSLSGMAKILSNAERSYRSNEELILTKFRDFLGMETVADSRMIRNREFVDLLSDFSRLRNRAAHIQEPDFETYSRTMKLVIDIDQPGLIFQVLGV